MAKIQNRRTAEKIKYAKFSRCHKFKLTVDFIVNVVDVEGESLCRCVVLVALHILREQPRLQNCRIYGTTTSH